MICKRSVVSSVFAEIFSKQKKTASNVDTRTAELKNITDWATINNLSLNLSKSEEIVFIDKKKEIQLPNS